MIREFGGDYIQWLRGFYYTVRTGSVSESARLLSRRQPTVSQHIKNLEDNYNVILFDRSKGGMDLTPEGQELFAHAIGVFESFKEISDRLRTGKVELKDKITITSTHALTMYYLAPFVTNFKKRNPKVSFELIGGMLDVIKESIYSGKADFGVAFLDEMEAGYDVHHLFNTSLSLIANKENKFGIQKDISLSEIARMPFVGYPPASTIKSIVYRKFKQDGCKLDNILLLNHFELIKTFVKHNIGVSIIFDYALNEHDKTQLDITSLRKYFGDISIGIINRKRKYLNQTAKAFLAELKNIA